MCIVNTDDVYVVRCAVCESKLSEIMFLAFSCCDSRVRLNFEPKHVIC